jgi:AraC-like DNA-binding protein
VSQFRCVDADDTRLDDADVRPFHMSARVGAAIVNAAAALGAEPTELAANVGFDPKDAEDPEALMSSVTEEALWREGARLLHDDDFGLHVAELLRPGSFDVLDYVVRNAPTLREAFARWARYNRLEHDVAVFTLIDQGPVVRIEHTLIGGAVQHRHSAESTLAAQVVAAEQLTGMRLMPQAVEFRHAAPLSLKEHVRIFGVAPRFLAPVNAIVWAREALERPVRAADAALSRLLERHADALLASLPSPSQGHADRLRVWLIRNLEEGDTTLARAAAELKLSERSLQRRLAEQGLSFDGLLDEVRHALALRYLADPKIAISALAYRLGYSDASAFHRAFRRWTGTSPSLLRRAGQAAEGQRS